MMTDCAVASLVASLMGDPSYNRAEVSVLWNAAMSDFPFILTIVAVPKPVRFCSLPSAMYVAPLAT